MSNPETVKTLAELWLSFNEIIEAARYNAPHSVDLLAARQQGIADAALALGCEHFAAEVRRITTKTPRRPYTYKKKP